MQAGLPVVTMEAELHVTTGSYFVDKGYITEAEGDQPGSQAAEKEVAELMGFTPVVYGNVKGFLNRTPTREDMIYWADRQGITLDQCTSWTDGTKLQVEQTLVANGLGATIAQDGLVGPANVEFKEGADILGARATEIGQPISDYVLSREAPPGVFIVATHEDDQQESLSTYKMGDGPYYLLVRPYHLAFFEIPKTISRVLEGKPPLLTNSSKPTIGVAAVAKRTIPAGTIIERGIGGFDVRGEAVKIYENPDHVPIGLLSNAIVKHEIEPGQIVTFADIELPESLALSAWSEIKKRAVETPAPV
jgi:predicted homoserine dehydrogenase-like protein